MLVASPTPPTLCLMLHPFSLWLQLYPSTLWVKLYLFTLCSKLHPSTLCLKILIFPHAGCAHELCQVSEGIDFSDDAARMCVIIGIPYPSSKDLQVPSTIA